MTSIWIRGISQKILFLGSDPSDIMCTNEYTYIYIYIYIYINNRVCPDGVPCYTLKKVEYVAEQISNCKQNSAKNCQMQNSSRSSQNP